MKVWSEWFLVGLAHGWSSRAGAPHCAGTPSAPAGGWKTMMSPTFGSPPSRVVTRWTSTRSPTSSVGSIEPLGIRYGLIA
jgi:hypothetical protein